MMHKTMKPPKTYFQRKPSNLRPKTLQPQLGHLVEDA